MMMEPDSRTGTAGDRPHSYLNRHLVRDLEVLWSEVLKLAAVVETSLRSSVQALCSGKIELANEVKADEPTIDHWQVRIEQDCLRILALHQPVASDLRLVTSALKISYELERMGDLAAHIAKRARKLARRDEPVPLPPQMEYLGVEALGQVHDALDALTRGDTGIARQVIKGDREIDRRRQMILKDLKKSIRQDPGQVTIWLHLINIARNLERIADHATNLAETVVYVKEGTILRRDDPQPISEPS
jgi:phosphate transport system protein